MTTYVRLPLAVVLILLMNTSPAKGASVSIQPSGNGAFIVQGTGMDGVAGVELNLTYDSAALSLPKVTQGSFLSGALLASNTNSPGSIKISIISAKPFSGNGQIAAITFGKGSGNIKIASQKFIDSGGSPIVSGTANDPSLPGLPFSEPSYASPTANIVATSSLPGTTAVISSMPAYPGTVTMPSDTQAKNETKMAEAVIIPVPPAEPVVAKPAESEIPAAEKPALETQKPEKIKMTSYKSTLDNFRTYKGVKSPANLIELIKREIAPTIRHEPSIALSNGKTPLKILVRLEGVAEKSPNFALNGAKLVSLRKEDSTWIIEALPQPGIVRASLTILTESDIIEYPLTLAPPVDAVSLSEADFAVFLKDGESASPKRDLNGDGKHDYLDDYIYTVNYLNKSSAGKTK